MPPHRGRNDTGPTDLLDADISFPLARLFDPFNLDHVPERKRMEHFEHRDLAHIKHYKAAVKIFGGPLSRKRILIAPPMETPLKHRLGNFPVKVQPPIPATQFNSTVKPQIPAEKPPPEELVIAKQAEEREDKYKAWFKERKMFRNNLENMGLNMEWLIKKPNKTQLEKRVLNEMRAAEGKKKEEDAKLAESPEPVEIPPTPDSEASELPQLKIPAPLGLKILDEHLRKNKLRLIDLFTSVDKNKDWHISREEFIKSCEEKNIPISKGLLEDMLISLDMNLDEVLNYKEMAIGLEHARREKREDRRKEISRESTLMSQNSAKSSGSAVSQKDEASRHATPEQKSLDRKQSGQTATNNANRNPTPVSNKSKKSSNKSSEKEAKSDTKSNFLSSEKENKSELDKILQGSHSSEPYNTKGSNKSEAGSMSGTSKEDRPVSPYLEPPLPDTRLEQMILPTEEQMVDLRKRDREGLKGYNAKLKEPPGTILTGNAAIDNHSMTCTMHGEIGDMVDKFRSKRLREYYSVVHLCKRRNISLSQNLLERILLYPPERPHSQLRKLRHPDSAPLVSAHFADSPKRPRTPIEVKHRDKVRRSKSGKLLIDSRHKYPMGKSVAAEGSKMNLSTGRAVIRRHVDCWMTFEQYEQLTKALAIRYQHLHGNSSENAFWPGHLLDKLRLCMPPYDKPAQRDKEAALYRRVHRTPAVNYGYEPADVWQTNDSMYVQVGIHDHFKNKTII